MKKITIYTSIFLAALVLTFACKKEKPELNISDHDPCGCASEVSADFDILELVNVGITVVETPTDHILDDRYAKFVAKEENAQYTWYIGSQTFNTKEASRYFSRDWIGYNIPITLVVQKIPNSTCFPNDDGYDSVTKIMHVYDHIEQTDMEGVFRMARVNTTDSFDIELSYSLFGPWRDVINISNYDNENSDCPSNQALRYAMRAYRGSYTEELNAIGCKFLKLNLQRPLGAENPNYYIMKNKFQISHTNGSPWVEWELHGRKL
jgi:hypothetical protein